jgi:hypothetical protein
MQNNFYWKAREKHDNYINKGHGILWCKVLHVNQAAVTQGIIFSLWLYCISKTNGKFHEEQEPLSGGDLFFFVQSHRQCKFLFESAFLTTREARNLTFLSSLYWRGAKNSHPCCEGQDSWKRWSSIYLAYLPPVIFIIFIGGGAIFA